MATYSKRLLSGSTDGKGVLVAATTSPGTTIHTAVSGTADFDEIWLYAINQGTVDIDLTLQFGGTSTQDGITVTIPSKVGMQLIVPGMLLNNGSIVKAYAGTTNLITIQGFVNRIVA